MSPLWTWLPTSTGNVLDDARGARDDVHLLGRLHRAGVAQHAADRARRDRHGAHDEAAATWRAALLRRDHLGWLHEHGRGERHASRQDEHGRDRKGNGLIGGQPSKQWEHGVGTSARGVIRNGIGRTSSRLAVSMLCNFLMRK